MIESVLIAGEMRIRDGSVSAWIVLSASLSGVADACRCSDGQCRNAVIDMLQTEVHIVTDRMQDSFYRRMRRRCGTGILLTDLSANAGAFSTMTKQERASIPDNLPPGVQKVRGPALDGFQQFSFAAAGFQHCVYYAGDPDARAILVMPELAGVSPGLLMFVERLVTTGFQVYVPWLFGPFGRRAPAMNAIRLCVSREFANLRAGVSAPVTSWLRALAAYISERNNDERVGAIGMCLTGAFAIPLIIEPGVAAAVAAQPSVPLSPAFALFGVGDAASKRALNISEDEVTEARQRLASGAARLLAVRCRADRICPHEKLQRLQQEFPVGLEVREYGEEGSRNRLGDRPHATFTKEYRLEPGASADHLSRQAFTDLVAFFDTYLHRQSGR